MTHVARCLAVALAMLACPAGATGASASGAVALATALREATLSDGFEARINVASLGRSQDAAVTKLAIVGQFEPQRQRLLIRAIAPRDLRDRTVIAEQTGQGVVRAQALDAAGSARDVSPMTPLFGTAVQTWDLFQPWWRWPAQELGGTERVAGRDCRIIRSTNPDEAAPIRTVVSCVHAELSLRTQLLDGRGEVVRTLVATRLAARESGRPGVKGLTIIAKDGSRTEVDTYSIDEHHRIDSDTFGQLVSLPVR